MESEYGDLQYFTEIRCLSRGARLARFFTLQEEIGLFMEDKGRPIRELNNTEWICDLAFLVDITQQLNGVNVRLQGQEQHTEFMMSKPCK
jgi:hypothetical protein